MSDSVKRKPFLSVRDMVLCALFAALTAVCAWISVPVLEIAFTLQTFAVCLTLGLLGGKRGTVAVLVYILLGLVGAPVFAGFQSTSALMGVTGGYIVGFIAMALVYWGLAHVLGEKPWVQLLSMVLGLVVCYAFGSVWFEILYIQKGNAITFGAVLMKCVVPYLIPDGCKIALAYFLTQKLKRFVP